MRYPPRHARPSFLTRPRHWVSAGAVAGVLGLAAVATAVSGGTSGAPARAAVPRAAAVQESHEQQSVSRPALALNGLHLGPFGPGGLRGVADAPTRHDARAAAHVVPASALASDGIPSTALLAYQRAAGRQAALDPGCRLTWPLLAAIGRVESDHGRFAGAVLHTDGTSTPRVIGIPLNGHGTALIRDTDGGRLDGDPVYDRAVGPMQFIPSTWAGWGVDANGDGIADPFNVFDAAAAAAGYLCAAGGDLSTARGQVQALLSYNHSYDYVLLVMSIEQLYASGAGIVVPTPAATHSVPKPTLPPVDPGTPRGTTTSTKAAPSHAPVSSATGASGSGSASTSAPSSSAPASSVPSSSAPASSVPSSGTTTPAPTSSTETTAPSATETTAPSATGTTAPSSTISTPSSTTAPAATSSTETTAPCSTTSTPSSMPTSSSACPEQAGSATVVSSYPAPSTSS